MIHILTDSTSDLSPQLIERFCIEVVPLTVIMNGQTYHDQQDITLPQLFQTVEQTGQLPKTSAPSVPEFAAFFDRPGEKICLSLSSQLSATYQNALLAASMIETLPKPRVIDSLNLSTGIGLLALKAAELRDQGKSAAEIEREIRANIPKVRTSFIIDTLEYLYKGGRCSAIQNIMSSLLMIRPVIEVRPDGTLRVKDKIHGSRAKALRSMLESFKADLPRIDLHRVFVTHTGCDKDAAFLKEELLKLAPIENVEITYAGCVVASHCGPNTIGILYLLR